MAEGGHGGRVRRIVRALCGFEHRGLVLLARGSARVDLPWARLVNVQIGDLHQRAGRRVRIMLVYRADDRREE